MGHSQSAGATRARSTVTRQLAALAAVIVTALASLATSPGPEKGCPKTAEHEEAADLVPRGTIERRYFVSAKSLDRVQVVLEATSLANTELRARVEPASGSFSDADTSVRLVLTPGTKTIAELDVKLAACTDECSQELALIVEHVQGPTAALDWKVVVDAQSCDDDFQIHIEKL